MVVTAAPKPPDSARLAGSYTCKANSASREKRAEERTATLRAAERRPCFAKLPGDASQGCPVHRGDAITSGGAVS